MGEEVEERRLLGTSHWHYNPCRATTITTTITTTTTTTTTTITTTITAFLPLPLPLLSNQSLLLLPPSLPLYLPLRSTGVLLTPSTASPHNHHTTTAPQHHTNAALLLTQPHHTAPPPTSNSFPQYSCEETGKKRQSSFSA